MRPTDIQDMGLTSFCRVVRRRAHSLLLLSILLSITLNLASAQQDDWTHSPEAEAYKRNQESRKAELVRINGTGTHPLLTSRLLEMRKVDQSIRTEMFGAPGDPHSELIPELKKTDRVLTNQLEGIVSADGWPTIALVGIEASQAAALLLIHSPDHDFQQNLLPTLERLVEEKKIVGTDIALLTDKILVASGKPQRFGTNSPGTTTVLW